MSDDMARARMVSAEPPLVLTRDAHVEVLEFLRNSGLLRLEPDKGNTRLTVDEEESETRRCFVPDHSPLIYLITRWNYL